MLIGVIYAFYSLHGSAFSTYTNIDKFYILYMLFTASMGLPLAHILTHLFFLAKQVSVSLLNSNMLYTGLSGLPLAHYPNFISYMFSFYQVMSP